MSKIPEGCTLEDGYNRELIESDEYDHWTVGDLIEFLGSMSPDANLWLHRTEWLGDSPIEYVRPLEKLFGDVDDVFIG